MSFLRKRGPIPKSKTAYELVCDTKHVSWLSTGCPNLDQCLKNGIPSQGIFEIGGEAGAGKTQFCMQLLIQARNSFERGGLGGSSCVIYTEGTFPINRLVELATEFDPEHVEEILDGIFVAEDLVPMETEENNSQTLSTAFARFYELLKCRVQHLNNFLKHQHNHFGPDKNDYPRDILKLLVIDSIGCIFRNEQNDGDYRQRAIHFREIVGMLKHFVDKGITVVLSNQVSDVFQSFGKQNLAQLQNVRATSGTRLFMPALGPTWANLVNHRILLSRLNRTHDGNSVREMKVVFSPIIPRNRINYIVTPQGVLGIEGSGHFEEQDVTFLNESEEPCITNSSNNNSNMEKELINPYRKTISDDSNSNKSNDVSPPPQKRLRTMSNSLYNNNSINNSGNNSNVSSESIDWVSSASSFATPKKPNSNILRRNPYGKASTPLPQNPNDVKVLNQQHQKAINPHQPTLYSCNSNHNNSKVTTISQPVPRSTNLSIAPSRMIPVSLPTQMRGSSPMSSGNEKDNNNNIINNNNNTLSLSLQPSRIFSKNYDEEDVKSNNEINKKGNINNIPQSTPTFINHPSSSSTSSVTLPTQTLPTQTTTTNPILDSNSSSILMSTNLPVASSRLGPNPLLNRIIPSGSDNNNSNDVSKSFLNNNTPQSIQMHSPLTPISSSLTPSTTSTSNYRPLGPYNQQPPHMQLSFPPQFTIPSNRNNNDPYSDSYTLTPSPSSKKIPKPFLQQNQRMQSTKQYMGTSPLVQPQYEQQQQYYHHHQQQQPMYNSMVQNQSHIMHQQQQLRLQLLQQQQLQQQQQQQLQKQQQEQQQYQQHSQSLNSQKFQSLRYTNGILPVSRKLPSSTMKLHGKLPIVTETPRKKTDGSEQLQQQQPTTDFEKSMMQPPVTPLKSRESFNSVSTMNRPSTPASYGPSSRQLSLMTPLESQRISLSMPNNNEISNSSNSLSECIKNPHQPHGSSNYISPSPISLQSLQK